MASTAMEKQSIRALEKILGHRFKDKQLLVRALTHPSHVQGTDQADLHNQRLEFLGDAILGMIVAHELFLAYPQEREGFLTKARASICHGKGLTELARGLGLESFALLGRSERVATLQNRSLILGDCIEAIIGAVYIDGGFRAVQKLVRSWVIDRIRSLDAEAIAFNYKGALQEWAQSGATPTPVCYELVDQKGPDHARVFTVAVVIRDQIVAKASGYSKKDAETLAAKQALEVIRNNDNRMPADSSVAGNPCEDRILAESAGDQAPPES